MFNVHSTSYTAVCHMLLGYIVLELTTACLVFIILPVLWGSGWSSDKGLCSEFVHVGCVDKVVDGPHGW